MGRVAILSLRCARRLTGMKLDGDVASVGSNVRSRLQGIGSFTRMVGRWAMRSLRT